MQHEAQDMQQIWTKQRIQGHRVGIPAILERKPITYYSWRGKDWNRIKSKDGRLSSRISFELIRRFEKNRFVADVKVSLISSSNEDKEWVWMFDCYCVCGSCWVWMFDCCCVCGSCWVCGCLVLCAADWM